MTQLRGEWWHGAGELGGLYGFWRRHMLDQAELGERPAATVRTYLTGAGQFVWNARESTLADITRDTILAWRAQLRREGYRASTMAAWLNGAKCFTAWLVESGRLVHDPALGIRADPGPAQRQHRKHTLTKMEVHALLAAPDGTSVRGVRDRAIIALMLYCGLRTIEVSRANVADLERREGRLLLWVHGKGRQAPDQFVVVASDLARAALDDWLRERGEQPGPLFPSLRCIGERLTPCGVGGTIRKYFKQIGIDDPLKTVHSLRHTFITTAIERGAPIQKVKAAARHASIATTMVYYHELSRLEEPAEDYVEY